jgi:hypothetical protein
VIEGSRRNVAKPGAICQRGSNLLKEPHLAFILHCLRALRKASKLRKATKLRKEEKAGLSFKELNQPQTFLQ